MGQEPTKIEVFHETFYGDKVLKAVVGQNQLVIIESGHAKILKTLFGINYYRGLKLKHSEVPGPIAIGQFSGKYLFAMSEVGESFAAKIQRVALRESGTVERVQELLDIERKLQHAGVAFGELHSKNAVIIPTNHPQHQTFVAAVQEKYQLDQVRFLNGGIKRGLFIESPKTILKKHPVMVGMVHGDAHLNNITWNQATNKVGLIDMESFTQGLTVDLQPSRYPVVEYARTLCDIVSKGKILG